MTLTLAFLGPQETIVIALLLLLLFGAKKLPELARGMGKSMGEFKKAREEFEEEVSKGEDQARKDDDKS
ncbi:MAG: sec-independent protein translocase protein TatA [Verrucomicrobiales bacterium]|jgi:sec-independent protein translocase protein TatA